MLNAKCRMMNDNSLITLHLNFIEIARNKKILYIEKNQA